MSENLQRTVGRPGAYKLDRGGAPAESGPFIGEVRNNFDPTRSGRIQVWIEDFAGPDKNDSSLWRTLSYVSPFYGTTQQYGSDQGDGTFVGNPHSYGMWFTPPDIGTQVICFFASGDPNQGYYVGSVIQPGLNHMVPAIGASRKYVADNSAQSQYFSNSTQLPTTEFNDANVALSQSPQFFNQPRPVHSVVASVLLQQGLVNDTIRGSIGSNSMRESPSSVYGVSSPGRPVYAGGLDERTIRTQLETGQVQPQDVTVIARRGGHSLVMDDGDLEGRDQLVRIRTAKGHQIIMNDSGDAFHFIHANGQSWIEMGSEGTIDMYSTNSINLRSQGDINLHADRNINLNSNNGSTNIAGNRAVQIESEYVALTGKKAILAYSDKYIGVKTDGTLSMNSSKAGTWNGGSNMALSAGCISLNGGSAPEVPKTTAIVKNKLPDVKFQEGRGWVVESGALETIVSRAPTHEPYPLHGRGVSATADLNAGVENLTFPSDVEEKFDSIQDTEVDTITLADYENQDPASISVGDIQPEQVTAMLAQAKIGTGQDFNDISDDTGVGKYGFTPEQLEASGYLKPGTVQFYLSDGTANATTILNSPSVWTGLAGVSSVGALLSDPSLQDAVQTDLYVGSLNKLKSAGIVTGQEQPSKLAGLVQAGSKYPVETIKGWIKGTGLDSQTTSSIDKLVRGAQFAVDLADMKVNEAIKGFTTASNAATNTTARGGVNLAVDQVIGNPKVPAPDYSSGFFAATSDADLVYTGDDPIVIDRINTERARRGLPPLPGVA